MALWPEIADIEHRVGWIDAAGVPTRCLEAGYDKDDALLLLHGTGGHFEAYMRNIKAHAEHFHIYAIDMIGHGYTGKPPFDYDIDAHIAHLLNFCDAIGCERINISGESLGGWIAMRLAARHPERVDKLVLNTPGGRTFNIEANQRIYDLSMKAVREPSRENVRKRLEWLMHDPADVTDDLVESRYRIYCQPGFIDAMERICCILVPPERRKAMMVTDDELREIQAASCVIWTGHDPQGAVEIGEKIAELIPDSQYHVMEDCGHWPQWEDAETFNRLSLDFLTA
jgi:2-hydroxy-6-oxonona-2,4-dienedioate hydrolase